MVNDVFADQLRSLLSDVLWFEAPNGDTLFPLIDVCAAFNLDPVAVSCVHTEHIKFIVVPLSGGQTTHVPAVPASLVWYIAEVWPSDILDSLRLQSDGYTKLLKDLID